MQKRQAVCEQHTNPVVHHTEPGKPRNNFNEITIVSKLLKTHIFASVMEMSYGLGSGWLQLFLTSSSFHGEMTQAVHIPYFWLAK